MQYLGGKSKVAKYIAKIINEELGGGYEISRRQEQYSETHSGNYKSSGGGGITFVSLFCGSCVIESLVNAETKILNDKHEYLIEMYKALQNGYELPENLSKERYQDIKANKDRDKALTGFVGFGCSFGGKWFDGYAQNRAGRNYCLEAKKHTMKLWNGIENAKFICGDYRDVEIPDGSVVYADAPYVLGTGYSNSKDFNHEEFWEYMRQLSKNHKVFISEENAPEDFECIWQKEVRRTLDANKSNQPKRIEKLFIWKGNKNEN